MNNAIQIVSSSDINKEKWDECIHVNKAPIYASYHYLQGISQNWVALVFEDYKAVWPLCLRIKFGIKYTYLPAFCQQLGLIGNPNFSQKEIEKAIYLVAKYGDVFCSKNQITQLPQLRYKQKTNFELLLHESYEIIKTNYKTDLNKNLKKVLKQELIYKNSEDVELAINTYEKYYGSRMLNVKSSDFKNFIILCIQLKNEGKCLVREVVNAEGQLLSIALFLKDDNRLYNIANSTTTVGRNTEANHYLMDRIIHEFSSTSLILDFEGSDLPGVKTFYQKFGATVEPYFHWHFNKLSWCLKLLKK